MSELLKDGMTHFRHRCGLEQFTHKEFLERVVVLSRTRDTPTTTWLLRVRGDRWLGEVALDRVEEAVLRPEAE